ncbi:hypothetical protein [uncultured Christiangramia sp.]|uniref:hypothetical protein n=1 Tax=uncultured Christiangramia sp. TaxID=503836 RepID=UPI00262B4C78|nr:hypothetical protein [uncultured Christiangramia sp.]|tara:strand:+ start:389 stop:622 length:234 start_codon:yes stop_codon:yes gene_type:complete
MKKQFFGALALALMVATISCTDKKEDSTETPISPVATPVDAEASLDQDSETTSEMMSSEAAMDTTVTPEATSEVPQI